ncbi:acyl-CoA dehydrogenase family protein [Mycobacterium sp. SMC-4]|uniref:acyl-CoA dehydrogenase family protein n=1 Tax=Mycobacterium sp. SMC-4 TaxID=2857059 RepID=UPI0021B452D8|nr:acyl-CoA dehydrogenase family protein [Mycobacterium sp. SMC-4]UXA20082.1 acyl-CoA/acyl-ACP dehydrogenase [Mycobacterium sp. SMC-4]
MPRSELDELREAVRDFLGKASPSQTVREVMSTESGFDDAVWQQMATELGLHGIAVPEEWGGAGAGMPELAVVFEEMGAALLCAPFFSTVALATSALLFSADQTAIGDYVPAFVDGSVRATLILNSHLDAWDPRTVTLTARRVDGGYRISGLAPMVLDGHTADIILLAANTEVGPSLFAVSSEATGMRRRPLAGLDRTRKFAHLDFEDVPARLIGAEGDADAALQRTSDIAALALAAEQLGAAQRCLDMAVDYARSRIQFGRAIGSFQAVKHRCTDMLISVEGARSAVTHAAEVADGEELATAVSVAKMACSEAFLQVAVDNLRVHGGIGFTWEHDGHLYIRRAKSSELMLGSPDFHAERLAALVTA